MDISQRNFGIVNECMEGMFNISKQKSQIKIRVILLICQKGPDLKGYIMVSEFTYCGGNRKGLNYFRKPLNSFL